MTVSERNEAAAARQLASHFVQGDGRAFNVPNMDGLNEDELLALQHVFERLAWYAEHKREAMGQRVRGRIIEAQNLERDCDQVYRRLPEWARW